MLTLDVSLRKKPLASQTSEAGWNSGGGGVDVACQIWYSDICILLYYLCTDYLEITLNSDNYNTVQLWYFAFKSSCILPPLTEVMLFFRNVSLKTVTETEAKPSRKVKMFHSLKTASRINMKNRSGSTVCISQYYLPCRCVGDGKRK